MNSKKVPFYPNTPDNTHCFQAAIKMVLKYFLPQKDFSFEELEKMSAKKEGLWTWATAMLIELHKMGFEIKDIDDFDGEKFIQNGGDYLIEKYGEQVGNAQIKHSDIHQERELWNEYIKLGIHEKRIPSLEEIKNFLDMGFLVCCNVNSAALNNTKGYAGHFVVLFSYDADSFTLHDPGLPPLEKRKVSFSQFTKAWSYPNSEADNITAFFHSK